MLTVIIWIVGVFLAGWVLVLLFGWIAELFDL